MVRDYVWRDVAYPRRTRSHVIGQVDCRENDDGLLNSALENTKVSGGQSMDWLAIPIEHRDVDLNDVRGGVEDWHLLPVGGSGGADRDSGDKQCCGGLSHRVSPGSRWIPLLPPNAAHTDGGNRTAALIPCPTLCLIVAAKLEERLVHSLIRRRMLPGRTRELAGLRF